MRSPGVAGGRSQGPGRVVAPLAIIALSNNRIMIFGMVREQVGAEVRSTAAAVLLTSMHLLGDFISWPLVGAMSTTMAGGGLAWLRELATSLGVRGTDHLSIALVSISLPVALLGSLFYMASARLTKAHHERRPSHVLSRGAVQVRPRHHLEWQAPGFRTALRLPVPALFDGIDADE